MSKPPVEEPDSCAANPTGAAGAAAPVRPRRVFITVAEVSGDRHAAQLIRAIKEIDPEVIIEGLGGPEMAAAGAVIHRNTVTRAAMGIRGALRAFEVYGMLRWARRHFDRHRPDVWVGVDSPSMNFHFARAAKERGIPTMQYVAPQLWAWAEWRMKKLRRWVDRLACILPFEEAYFRRHGVNATFVGHPLFDQLPPGRGGTPGDNGDRAARPPVIGLLPGSRRGEAEANFPRMLDVARQVLEAFPGASFLVPTTVATDPVVRAALETQGTAAKQADGHAVQAPRLNGEVLGAHIQVGRDAFDQMVPRCDLCLTVSGTATLHVAGFGVPMIVVYHGSRLLWNLVGRWLLRTRTYALVNVLAAGSPEQADPAHHAVPEFIPWFGPTEPAARMAIAYLQEPQRLAEQRRRLETVVRTLDRPGASANAARMVMSLAGARLVESVAQPLSPDPIVR
jgi:lipid-A-disaccharide synthase